MKPSRPSPSSEKIASINKDPEKIQKRLDTGDPAMGFPIKGLKLSATVDITQEKKTGRNVLGRLQVDDTPAHEIVVVGAHIDHLGAGPNANSLAKGDEDYAQGG